MKNKIESPKISIPLLEPQDVYSLESREEICNKSIEDLTIDNQEANRVSFDKVLFKNVVITESALREIELTDTIFEKCDLSNIDFSGSFIHRTEFRDCKLIGTDFSNSRLQNVSFLNCLGDYSVFRFSKCKQVSFEECSLISIDFYNSNLQTVYFPDCNIDQAMFTGSKLKGIDLSSCSFDGLNVEIEDLDGCMISAHHASSFAGLMGLIVK